MVQSAQCWFAPDILTLIILEKKLYISPIPDVKKFNNRELGCFVMFLFQSYLSVFEDIWNKTTQGILMDHWLYSVFEPDLDSAMLWSVQGDQYALEFCHMAFNRG